MAMVKERINKLCEKLLSLSSRKILSVEGLEYVESGYKVGHTPPNDGWKELGIIKGAHKHFWLRGKFATPEADESGSYVLRFSTGVDGRDMLNPQGILYLNGKMVQGIDTNHMEAFLEPSTEYEMYLYLYTAYADIPFVLEANVMLLDSETEGLYYDLLTPLEALYYYNDKTFEYKKALNENTSEYIAILSALEKGANFVDMRNPYSSEYYESIRNARRFLKEEFYEKLCSTENKPTVHCVGHTHIDVEWRWERMQTREKVQRSIATAIALMQKYPEYQFTLTQPELYRYLKEEAPEKYEEVLALVKQNRWEPEGAMWVECDCNLASGESLIRQILHGKRFFKEEFNSDSKILFLPDVFGYSAAMPQILKKSGIDYFVTSKISWNETNVMPYDSFMWKGIDGTEIFSSFITAQTANEDHGIQCKTTYSGTLNAPFVLGTWDRYQQKEYNKNTIITYGYGDGGGGPTRQMLEKQRRLAYGLPGLPVTKTNFMLPYLRECEKEFLHNSEVLKRTPKWVGELYLEYHRGTYTTMAKNKRGNRKSEFLLQKAEALSYADLIKGGHYDKNGLDKAWKTVLHDQFHDILPGTCVREVYEWTEKDYQEVEQYCNGVISDKLAVLANGVEAKNGILVYNSLGFARNGVVALNGKTVEIDEAIPAYGWKVVETANEESSVSLNGLTAENQYYILTLAQDGTIESLFDKTENRQVFECGKKGNLFCVYEDMPYSQYEAWDIADYFRSKRYALESDAQIECLDDGSRRGFSVTRSYMDSTICQKIWMYSNSRRIDFETEIDWHEKHQLLKVEFPLDIHADEAVYEIQYGHVHRATHSNTSWDSAKFEVCGHKWVDVSEYGYGVALLNDCKYGFATNGSCLELTVLKRPTYPNPDSDEGKHVFTYSLLPHKDDFRKADVIKEAYSLNQPMDALCVGNGERKLPDKYSLVSCDKDNIIIETVKKAEADDGMIVRLYDAFDCRCDVKVSVANGFDSAYLCDMMENELEKLDFDGNTLQIPVKNFEIVTLKFKRKG
ncbi:MAG: alpha-mannosidase [Clostridia bacterium]|nr:alpha-mannosidase [Clostridia bacterium]